MLLGDIGLVNGTLEQRLLVKLLVEVLEVELQAHRRSNRNQSTHHHQDESKLVARIVGLAEEVRRNNVADLAKHIAQSHCDGAVLRGASHCAGHPGADERVRCVHPADVNERRSVAGCAVHRTKTDDVADAAEGNGTGKVIATLRGLVGVPGIHKRTDGSADVRRTSKQKSNDATVPKSSDNIREEVRESISGGDTDVERDEEDHLPVESGHFQTRPDAGFGF